MHVTWDTARSDLPECWLWQYGSGPFKVVKEHDVPASPRYLGNVEITYEPGTWVEVELPADSYFAEVHRVQSVLFHKKWLKAASPP